MMLLKCFVYVFQCWYDDRNDYLRVACFWEYWAFTVSEYVVFWLFAGFSSSCWTSAILHSKRLTRSFVDWCIFKHQPLQDTEGLLLLVRVSDDPLSSVRLVLDLILDIKANNSKPNTVTWLLRPFPVPVTLQLGKRQPLPWCVIETATAQSCLFVNQYLMP